MKFDLKTSETEDRGDPIPMYDARGSLVYVERSTWRKSLLPEQFRKAWESPDDLYNLVLDSIQLGFFLEALSGSEQLLEIDKNAERSYTVRSIAFMKNGLIDEAGNILEEFIGKFGETAITLCNYAKVFAEKGENVKAEEVLWKSLSIDPNGKNALDWFGAIHRERNGSSGHSQAMRRVSSIAGSWRAQLFLSENCLAEGRTPEAMVYYSDVMVNRDLPADCYMKITGDLGRYGLCDHTIELIGHRYVPEKYGIGAGLNLIQCCIQTGKKDLGKQLLMRISKLNRPDVAARLNELSVALEKLPEVANGA